MWPVLAAVLWEIGSLEERRAARNKGGRPDRRIALVRLLHPVEAFRVALLLAARQDLAQEEATTEVRISRAAYRWYRLRRAQLGAKRNGRMTHWAYRLAEMNADARAQDASERAGCSDPVILKRVVARLQLRVRQSDIAGLNLRNPAAIEAILSTLIGNIPPIPPDGTFAWGINKIASALGIGNPRATKFVDTRSEWLPKALAAHPVIHPDTRAARDQPDHFDQALALANETKPPATPQDQHPAPATASPQPPLPTRFSASTRPWMTTSRSTTAAFSFLQPEAGPDAPLRWARPEGSPRPEL